MTKATKKVINNWEYEISYNNNNPIIKVKPNSGKNILEPKTLSKYFPLNHNSLNTFLNNKLYVAQPDDFNDLFEFNLHMIDFSKYEFKDIENLIQPHLREKALEEFNLNPNKYLDKVKYTFYQNWIELNGILCLTEDKYNDLMWAHYTQNYGFLIEFDFKKFPVNHRGPFPINYIIKKDKLYFSREIDANLGFFIEALTKKSIWDYEREYRFFFFPQNNMSFFKINGIYSNADIIEDSVERYISYSNDAILKVILGYNFFINCIKMKINEHHYNIDIQGEMSLKKICLLNKLIKDEIKIESVVQNTDIYELSSIPIEVKHIGGTIFEIIEKF